MAKPGRNDDDDRPDAPLSGSASGNDGDYDDNDDQAPWYSWERWKYIGGTLFLLLSVTGVGYVLWDIIDLLPKPVTVAAVRAALRESPGRITDVLALPGMISFGPPAGVDLMFGATKAARAWARTMQKKDIAIGERRGIAIGERRGRRKLIAELRARANGSPEVHKLLDEVDADREEK